MPTKEKIKIVVSGPASTVKLISNLLAACLAENAGMDVDYQGALTSRVSTGAVTRAVHTLRQLGVIGRARVEIEAKKGRAKSVKPDHHKAKVDLDAAREACRQIERASVAKAAEADRLAESIPEVQIEGMIGNVALKGLPSKAAEIFSVAGGTGWVKLKVWDTHMDRMSGIYGSLLVTARTSAFTPLVFRLQPKAVQAKLQKGS